jgi:hypothetical protein
MYKLLRMTLLSLPLAGGVALAQSTPLDGPQQVAPTAATGTTDTRTPTQKRAGDIDVGNGTVPSDLVPGNGIRTAPMSDRSGLPDGKQMDSTTTTTTTKTHKKTQKSSSDTDATPMANPENGIQNGSTGATKPGDFSHDSQNSDK